MKQTKLLNILAKVKSFPSMPEAAAKLLKLLDNPDATAAQIGQILRYDPGLTANLLRLTNSAYFGLPCQVGSVNQAVVLLGWKKLIQLVMASCVNAVMGKPVPGYDLPAGELWRHSIAVSVAAEGLAKELKVSASEEIFTAALLHDVGKLVLGGFVKGDLEKIETEASRGISFEVAEHMVLGTDHTEVGAQILKNWSFPPALVNAVRWHHDPDSAGKTDTLVDIVHVANILCLMIGIGVGREGLCYEPSPLATKRLGLRTNDLEMVASRTLQYVDDLCDVFEAK
ncbi:MAG: HDOD domain-containing protein [Deltaproteobacteria bacterium]|nr:HDOD domain-containing protein [Deltaproteobacteria bacterium]